MSRNETMPGQMSLFDMLAADGDLAHLSIDDIEQLIEGLQEAKTRAKKREEKERRRKEQEKRERLKREEQARKEAHIQAVTSMELPLDWENAFAGDVDTQNLHTDSIADGIVYCLSNLGRVDIEYISSITGESCKTVIETLKGSIYQNPDTWGECFYKGWETADEYLSGNLRQKWNAAKKANEEYGGYFSDNLAAIEKVIPPMVATKDIYVTLGSPWVPPDVIDDFIEHILGDASMRSYFAREYDRDRYKESLTTVHDEITGVWEIPEKNRYRHSVGVCKTYGTEKMEALYILEKTLNMKPILVTDEVPCLQNASGKKRVINQAETVSALEKQKKMVEEFQDWVWTDPRRKHRLKSIFEEKFSCVRRRTFDGSFLQFSTMSPDVRLYPYQKDAVARIVFTPNTLLAHDVGAGKTYVMIAAGQELRRMRLSSKNMYVVPNNIVGQWKTIFLSMYPDANVLCVEPKTFTPAKREAVLRDIQTTDYDGIIIAYSCFEQIPLSKGYYTEELEAKKEAIMRAVQQKSKAASKLKKKQRALEKALSALAVEIDDQYDTVYFDELGITRLFVDEAHNFKNVPIETQTRSVLGINATGSKRCQDMMDKVHMVQKKNNGKGVVLATGTPITNSITDVFVMQQYLQSGELAMLDLQNFDSWIGMFAEKTSEFEIDVDTNSYRLATRFSRFHNLPELTALLSSIADFHTMDESAGVPTVEGYSDALISKTQAFTDYLNEISHRADAVRHRYVSRKEDNMLKITTDGRKAALDLRLVDPTAGFTYLSKVARCSENVADIYYKTDSRRGTQLVFCDTSTPKEGFNLYNELKDRLVLLGVPSYEIAFVHDAETEKARARLFAKVREGEIRVLIGSTFKLGLGVNVQNKLVALHHLDVPWRPADMTQREGRILRQGNENKTVKIFRYITEGSFDAYSWQLLETKQRLIADLLSGSLTARSSTDVEGTVLNYAEVKALAVGDPLIKERVETANELSRCLTLQRNATEARLRLEKELLELPRKKQRQQDLIGRCEQDAPVFAAWKEAHPEPADTEGKKVLAERRKELRERIDKAVKENVLKPKETVLMSYGGFSIVLPENMTAEKPFVWLEREGRYYTELGDTEIGNLIRIENRMERLPEHLEKLRLEWSQLEKREQDIQAELAENEGYSEEIERLEEHLKQIDEALGVDYDEQ